ncbi:hypothetical protein C0995_003610 [Termitomyces sp. Mi166|nr:hypothetical protein C0995_003610 [Termitomyces sp. Mi166\
MALPPLSLNGMGGGRFQKMIIIVYCSSMTRSALYMIHQRPRASTIILVHLWKRTAAHGPLPLVLTATNIAPMELSVVAAMTASGSSAPPGPVPASQEPATNIATSDVTMALESGEVPAETVGSGP